MYLRSLVSKVKSVLAVVIFTTSASALATSYTYLGGANSLAHCQKIAGRAGFTTATFGGYVNGIYYWNACLGSNEGAVLVPQPVPHPTPVDNSPKQLENLLIKAGLARTDVSVYIVRANSEIAAKLRKVDSQLFDAIWRCETAYSTNDFRTFESDFGRMQNTWDTYQNLYAEISYLVPASKARYWNRLVQAMDAIENYHN
jgi:hypothetical protein